MPGDALKSTFVLRFTRIEVISGYHSGCRGMLQIQCLCCDLHASRRYQGTIIDADGCYDLKFCILFCTYRGDIRVPLCMPMDATNSTSALCFTCIEAISGYHYACRVMLQLQHLYCVLLVSRRYRGTMMDAEGFYTGIEATSGYHYAFRGMPRPQCLYCVLHASRRYEATKMDGEGCYEFNVCIGVYTRRVDLGVPRLMPKDATNSTFVSCFTCIEGISGCCCGFSVWIAFYTHRGDVGVITIIDAEGCYKFNVCIVFCTYRGGIRV